MKVGYARVSTKDQNIDLQVDALQKEGCDRIFTDIGISGAKVERKGLVEALSYLREGDSLIVWKLDRAFRSLRHMLELTNNLKQKNIEFKSLQDSIDTSSPGGRLVFHIMSSIAEFERDLIRERTRAGMQAARARGRKGGRPKKVSDKTFNKLVKLYDKEEMTVDEIVETVGVSRVTFYRRLHAIRKDK